MSRLTDEQRIKVIKWWHQKLSIIQIQRMRKTITRIIHKAPTRPRYVAYIVNCEHSSHLFLLFLLLSLSTYLFSGLGLLETSIKERVGFMDIQKSRKRRIKEIHQKKLTSIN